MPPFFASQATAHEFLPACRLLFPDGSAEQRGDRILGDAHPTGLFVAREPNGRLRAAALVQALPGALGVAWPPRGDSAEAQHAATAAACEWLRDHGVKVCQAFAATAERKDMAPLERSGFRHTTQLVFLRREPLPARAKAKPEQRLTFAITHPAFDGVDQTLLATHRGSLDCPELNAPRTSDELVQGFAAANNVEWYLATRGEERVGLAIIEPGVGEALELTYLGVVPGERGRGFGAELLHFLLASVAHSLVLNVSVDARNAPAMKLYARHGFVEYDRREVWLATWGA